MSAMHEVQFGEITYGIRQMDPIKQLHMVRRLAPLFASFGVTVGEDGKPKISNPFAAFQPAAEVLATMPDDQFDYIVKTSLGAVFRKTEAGWKPVMANGVTLFSDDLDAGTILRLVWEVGKANLEGFTHTLQSLGLTKGPAAKAGAIS